MLYRRKIMQGLLALTLLVGSAILVLGIAGYDFHSTKVLAYGITTTDFPIPSGSDPWGTAFDSQGNA